MRFRDMLKKHSRGLIVRMLHGDLEKCSMTGKMGWCSNKGTHSKSMPGFRNGDYIESLNLEFKRTIVGSSQDVEDWIWKRYNCIHLNLLWKVPQEYGVSGLLLCVICSLYGHSESCVCILVGTIYGGCWTLSRVCPFTTSVFRFHGYNIKPRLKRSVCRA